MLSGIVGVLPLAMGFCFYFNSFFFSYFRFKSPGEAMMTMFYTIQGDTVFDTVYGAHQVNLLVSLLLCFIWINLGIFVVNNISLSQV